MDSALEVSGCVMWCACVRTNALLLPDSKVDKAAAILRLMHIAELRDLQTAINEVLAFIQESTADPRTDAKLGKVGR